MQLKQNGYPPRRDEVFIETHTCKTLAEEKIFVSIFS